MRILSVSEMRALESTADMAGQSYAQMMEMAGQGVVRAILHRMPAKGRRVLVLVGPGNNGGDGLVAARLLKDAGADVTAYLTRKRDPKQDTVFHQAEEHGVTFVTAGTDRNHETLSRLTNKCHILIDALLGTGATPPLRGTLADVLRVVKTTFEQARKTPLVKLNAASDFKPYQPLIVAVDGPSGLDFNSGKVDASALKADITVTFATPKWGHFGFPGADFTGELVVADIGIPDGIDLPNGRAEVATPQMIQAWLPKRPLNAHKGTFGKALIVAGSVNYTGAAILAATAAVRAGAGLVTLAIPNILHPAIAPAIPEATYILLPHSIGVLDTSAISVVSENVEAYSTMLIGPGLSHTRETTAFLRGLLGLTPQKRVTGFIVNKVASDPDTNIDLPPLIVDADGLNILSEIPDWHTILPENSILTPHPGEMARLTGSTSTEVQANRLELARTWAAKWGHVVVLKGAFTIVAAASGETVMLPFANPGLSSAGTGDVLAGSIAAMRAQGLEAFEAAVTGVYLHALAGEIVKERLGIAGITASDIAHTLPEARKQLG